MAKYKKVKITFEDGVVTCKPSRAKLQPNKPDGMDSVRWEVSGGDAKKGSPVILWETDSPFYAFGADFQKSALLATNNTQVPGLYKYKVLFIDNQGRILGGVDPEIDNEDEPEPNLPM